MITVITKDCEDKGWWKGELDGKVGVFPDNFVKRVSQHLSPTETPEQMPDSPEKPKFQSLMTSPSRDNIKKLFENSGPSSVLSKATSFERLRVEGQNWIGNVVELGGTSIYGIRRYTRGAWLLGHLDHLK